MRNCWGTGAWLVHAFVPFWGLGVRAPRPLREVTLGVLEEARAADDHDIALRAIARLEKQAELCGRLAGGWLLMATMGLSKVRREQL
ncbi:MAG: hypothetical protein JO108_18990 [Acidobacteriaceae bacterium]|nr:hypothetical protein [Acidobacteriaceae bacterium]